MKILRAHPVEGWLGLVLFGLSLACSPAATITLAPSADTSLMEVGPNNNAGARPWVNAGSNMHLKRNRALLKFDIAGNVPAGARIVSNALALTVTQIPSDSPYPAPYFELHRMLRDWGEGTNNPAQSPGQGSPATTNEATWLTPFAFTTNAWTAPGGAAGTDYADAVTAVQIVYDTIQSPYLFPDPTADQTLMRADLELWLAQPETNFGWILLCQSEDIASTARRFASREDPDFFPALTLTYLIPPALREPQWTGSQFSFSFTALPEQNYAVEYRDSLSTGTWQGLVNYSAPTQPTTVRLQDSDPSPQRFYRVRTFSP